MDQTLRTFSFSYRQNDHLEWHADHHHWREPAGLHGRWRPTSVARDYSANQHAARACASAQGVDPERSGLLVGTDYGPVEGWCSGTDSSSLFGYPVSVDGTCDCESGETRRDSSLGVGRW